MATVVGVGLLLQHVDVDQRAEILEVSAFVVAILVVWLFTRRSATDRRQNESRAVAWYRAALTRVIEYRYSFCAAGMLVVIAAVWVLNGFEREIGRAHV